MKFKVSEILYYLNDPDVIIQVLEYKSENCFRGKIIRDDLGGVELGSVFPFNENEFGLTQQAMLRRYLIELQRR